MPVPDYLDIPDSDIDPESPINYSLLARLRDNLLAVIGGGLDAPSMQTSLIAPSGSGQDGALSNSFVFASPGYYDAEGGTISSALTLPEVTFLRVRGNLTITGSLTLQRDLSTPERLYNFLDVIMGNSGTEGGGGGGVGSGGAGTRGGSVAGAGFGASQFSNMLRPWMAKRMIVGGNGGDGDSGTDRRGGGAIFLIVDGDLDMTGGSIVCAGENGYDPAIDAYSGSAGGTIIVVCTGTITGGTYNASGGDGINSSDNTGAGGGGLVLLVAEAFAGSRTIDVTGGVTSGYAPGSAGNGYSLETTLPGEIINGMMLR